MGRTQIPPQGSWHKSLQLPPRVRPGQHRGSWQWSWLEGKRGKPNPSGHISQVSKGYEEMTLTDESLGGIRQPNQFAEHVMTAWTEEHPSLVRACGMQTEPHVLKDHKGSVC